MYNSTDDISGDKVKLDYDSLLFSAEMAIGLLLNQMEIDIRTLRNNKEEHRNIPMYLAADKIKFNATYLAQITETLAALRECETREKIEIVNLEKKEIK